MKQVAQNYKSGELLVVDVPPPACKPGGVLVRSRFSLISTGTEMMKVDEAKLSLLGKARARPDQLRKVRRHRGPSRAGRGLQARGQHARLLHAAGLLAVRRRRRGRTRAPTTSRSASWSRARATSTRCTPRSTGCRRTCACRRCRRVDPSTPRSRPSGAIAMQGVRRAEVAARRDGVRDRARPRRPAGGAAARRRGRARRRLRRRRRDALRTAERRAPLRARRPTPTASSRSSKSSPRLTGGLGADHVYHRGRRHSNDPVAHRGAHRARPGPDRRHRQVPARSAVERLLRQGARRPLLALVRARAATTTGTSSKASTTRPATCAGPSAATSRASSTCVERDALRLDLLVSGRFPVERPPRSYAQLADAHARRHRLPLRVSGPAPCRGRPNEARTAAAAPTAAPRRAAAAPPDAPLACRLHRCRQLRVVDAAAAPAPTTRRVDLARVATTRSLSAVNAQRRFGFAHASTRTPTPCSTTTSIDVVFIVTRHHSHAELACQALERGRRCSSRSRSRSRPTSVDRVLEVVDATGNDRLMVGFNRRFAPLFIELKSRFGAVGSPVTCSLLGERGPARRRGAGTPTRSSRARGSSAKAVTSSTR